MAWFETFAKKERQKRADEYIKQLQKEFMQEQENEYLEA